jgi:small subunit ribosomal protein S8
MQTDPIADMLTRIRNAGQARLARAVMPDSRMKREIARVLRETGFIREYAGGGGEAKKPTLEVVLRYDQHNEHIIEGLERVSRPGRRVYLAVTEIPKVRNGLGVGILSTPKGILTDEQAREAHVGGEFLARVW